MRLIAATLGLALISACQPSDPARDTIVEAEGIAGLANVEAICTLVPERYVYFEEREAGWDQACDTARKSIPDAMTSADRLRVIEALLDALYDPHISLNTNSGISPRLVPSGADYWIEDGQITAIRQGGSAAEAGLKVGDRILEINGMQMTQAALERVQPTGTSPSEKQLNWALNAAGAGYRGVSRQILVARSGGSKNFELGEPAPEWPGTYVSAQRFGDTLYLRINNSLGDRGADKAFLSELDKHSDAKSFIIDLRDTPGGGSTDYAEPMMGAFFEAPVEYQRIIPTDREPYNRELRTITGKFTDAPVVVLVGRWTGSMGEGMAVGFDATGRAQVVGSPMARLAGGMNVFELPENGIALRLPTYDLSHLDGTLRHEWVPPISVVADNGNDDDLALALALQMLVDTD